jgi:hypothetical protein
MNPKSLVNRFSFLSFPILICLLFFCAPRKSRERQIELPFPDDETAQFYQSRIDSSEYEWFLDSKGVASSFVNEYRMVKDGYSATDAILIGEGIFYATVEVELPEKILVLEMERPFKHLGRRSIWQVTEMKEKPWPKEK